MEIKQEHNSGGDNVAGNKIVNNLFTSYDSNSITSKMAISENYKKMDFSQDVVIKAFSETLIDLVKSEQEKCHSIVPVGHIRNQYRHYIDDSIFESVMRKLSAEKILEVNSVQVCYVPKDLNYKIDF